jgi:hypothetical protein
MENKTSHRKQIKKINESQSLIKQMLNDEIEKI